jgi:hypothetical protein
MAAGLGFKDFVTGEVLTAADVDGYLMQGVWVFASAAARDAAVTSPQEGNFAYLKDTNVTTYYTGSAWANLDTTGMTNPMTTTGDTIYSSSGSTPARLGIGSTGQVLTVAAGIPSWATPAGGGGMTLLSTTTLTGASVTVSSISGAYNTLSIQLRDFRTSIDDRSINLRFNGDTGSNYAVCTIHMNVGSLTGSAGVGTSLFVAKSNISSSAINLGQATIEVPLYASTSYNKFEQHYYGSTNPGGSQSGAGAGRYASTSAITSITIFPDAGNWDAGTMLIYGVN